MNYNNPKRTFSLPIIIAISLLFGILIGIYLPGKKTAPPGAGIRLKTDKLQFILHAIEERYVDSVNRKDLEEAAIPAMLKRLDPHSIYIAAKDLKRANEPLQGNFEGIGISFNMLTDTIFVISTIPGGPSEKVGLMPNDKIIFINDSLVGKLKGPRGTSVRLKVLRKGHNELLPFEIIRDKIPMYSVDVAYMANDNTGYIKLNTFAMTTYDEFMKGLKELRAKGMTKLILDLRGNSGGVMDAAIQIANQFLKKGDLIVYTKGRSQPREDERATGEGEFKSGDLVVLIDEFSASASEILAGALQDNDRGTIIGRRSFGKGLVQEQMLFNDGSGLRLTIARYYTPTGRSIQKPYNKGVDKYYADLNERFAHGEFEVSDSIHFSDSLKFSTPLGKSVYGGGGIMPDKFVPADTTGISSYFLRIRNLGLIYRFAMKYAENNREILKKFIEPGEFESYLDKQALLDQFVQFATNNGTKLDNKGFYPIWEEIDTTLKYAIEFLKK
jgi:carboxyl-terminal processing protease